MKTPNSGVLRPHSEVDLCASRRQPLGSSPPLGINRARDCRGRGRRTGARPRRPARPAGAACCRGRRARAPRRARRAPAAPAAVPAARTVPPSAARPCPPARKQEQAFSTAHGRAKPAEPGQRTLRHSVQRAYPAQLQVTPLLVGACACTCHGIPPGTCSENPGWGLDGHITAYTATCGRAAP